MGSYAFDPDRINGCVIWEGMMKQLYLFLAMLVFLFSCWVGLSLARNKSLWNDEVYSQVSTIGGHGYLDLIEGRVSEGNNGPFYYLVQKFAGQVFGYEIPKGVVASGTYVDQKAQLILRISPVVWMSLAIALIFYYFSINVALWAGLCAWLMTMSTFMVWSFWAEARPYSLLFLLTTVQSFLVLSCQDSSQRSRSLRGLILTHILLAFAAPGSIVQIVWVSGLFLLFGYGKKRDLVMMAMIPVFICFYYYNQTPKFPVTFPDAPWKLITANFPIERLLLVGAAGIYLWRKEACRLGAVFYPGMMLMAAMMMLLIFKIKAGPGAGYLMDGRHFIFLAPVGIIVSTFVLVRLMESSRSWVIQRIFLLLLIALAIPRIWKYLHLFNLR